MKTAEELKGVIVTRLPVLEKLADLMGESKVSPEEGEVLFAYMIGAGRGLRQVPINDPSMTSVLDSIILGWKMAVRYDAGE